MKIKPFLNPLLPRFTAVYAPSQNLSLDETLIKFKGRVQFRRFLPLKQSRFGLNGFVIADTSSNMGGVDLSDQRIATCSRRMKGNIWYYKILFHMLEVAVLNVHIMYQGAGHQGVSLGDFKELLVEQLIGGNSFRRDTLSWNVPEHVPDVHFNQEHLIIIV